MAHTTPLLKTNLSPRNSEDDDPEPATRYSADIESPIRSPASVVSVWTEGKKPRSRWRHAIGIVLLLCTVFLWTTSNFLASTIFADDSYSKPFFVTYVNSSFFIIPLIPMFVKHAWDDRHNPVRQQPILAQIRDLLQRRVGRYKLLREHEFSSSHANSFKNSLDGGDSGATSMLLGDDMGGSSQEMTSQHSSEGITLWETIKIGLEFSLLWFLANYFAAACLEYTTVASSTILASTSSIWTLFSGALLRVERFTVRKFIGVCASLAGVILISSIDVSGETDSNRGSFPHKTPRELAIGDTMAFVSAVLYGFYAVFMKKRIGDESKVNMPLFFGIVGSFNVLVLWPIIAILHWTRIETFAIPPTSKILIIVLVNSASSLVSDFCWAYSMLLTSPLIITVGLTLTIPLSLVGQMVLDKQYSSPLYWVGAAVMVLSFVFINHEDKREEDGADGDEDAARTAAAAEMNGVAGSARRPSRGESIWSVGDGEDMDIDGDNGDREDGIGSARRRRSSSGASLGDGAHLRGEVARGGGG